MGKIDQLTCSFDQFTVIPIFESKSMFHILKQVTPNWLHKKLAHGKGHIQKGSIIILIKNLKVQGHHWNSVTVKIIAENNVQIFAIGFCHCNSDLVFH